MIKNIEIHGYIVESHEVVTSDGYILSLIRIPNHKDSINNNNNNNEYRHPVLVVHGFQCTAADWLTDTEDKILPYQLVNEGYDCWLANLRGTPLSQRHVTLDPKSKQFWDFSVNETAQFDVPAMIDYILKVTGHPTVSYIGHSMGCAVFLACMALLPQNCSKVTTMIALAPAAYISNTLNKPIKNLIAPVLNVLSKIRYVRRIQGFHEPLIDYLKKLCISGKSYTSWVVKNYGVFFGAIGSGTEQIEKERMEKISEHWPSSFSFKMLCHGAQAIVNKTFAQFDYGKSENLQRYGQPSPPLYDLNKVSVPVATFYAKDDHLCSPQDVTRLYNELPNVIGNFGITTSQFTHGDFMFGKDANKLVYQPLIEILRKKTMCPVVKSLKRSRC